MASSEDHLACKDEDVKLLQFRERERVVRLLWEMWNERRNSTPTIFN
jgi:hypothetical protein